MDANPEQSSPEELDKQFLQFVELHRVTVMRRFKFSQNIDPDEREDVWQEVQKDLLRMWRRTGGLAHVPAERLVGYWARSLKYRTCTYLKRKAKKMCVSLPQDDVFPSPNMSSRLESIEDSEVCLQFFTELTEIQSQIFRLRAIEGFSIRKILSFKLNDGKRVLTKYGVEKALEEIEEKVLKFRSRYL